MQGMRRKKVSENTVDWQIRRVWVLSNMMFDSLKPITEATMPESFENKRLIFDS